MPDLDSGRIEREQQGKNIRYSRHRRTGRGNEEKENQVGGISIWKRDRTLKVHNQRDITRRSCIKGISSYVRRSRLSL